MPTTRRPWRRRTWLLFAVFTVLWYAALLLGNCLSTSHRSAGDPQPAPREDPGVRLSHTEEQVPVGSIAVAHNREQGTVQVVRGGSSVMDWRV